MENKTSPLSLGSEQKNKIKFEGPEVKIMGKYLMKLDLKNKKDYQRSKDTLNCRGILKK